MDSVGCLVRGLSVPNFRRVLQHRIFCQPRYLGFSQAKALVTNQDIKTQLHLRLLKCAPRSGFHDLERKGTCCSRTLLNILV